MRIFLNLESDSCMDVDQDSSFSSQNCEIMGDVDYSKTSCEENTVSSPPVNSYVTEEVLFLVWLEYFV